MKRNIPVDQAIKQIERDYYSGKIAINTDTGAIEPIANIYDDRYKDRVTYHFPNDRETQRTCQNCGTAFRTTEQVHDKDRCPFCYQIIQ